MGRTFDPGAYPAIFSQERRRRREAAWDSALAKERVEIAKREIFIVDDLSLMLVTVFGKKWFSEKMRSFVKDILPVEPTTDGKSAIFLHENMVSLRVPTTNSFFVEIVPTAYSAS
jgi:hypothetical protein